MRQLTTLLTVCSLIVGCGVPRPNTDICVVNAPAKHQKCYNMADDYNEDGQLKPGVKAKFKPAATVEDLNKFICTDPDGWAALKAYLKTLREEHQ